MIPFKKTMLAIGLLALSSGVASAATAVVNNDLHLRSGPGPNYGIVTVMPGGAVVQAWNCDGAWCRVNYGGQFGFASERYLDIGRAGYWRPGYRSYAYEPGYRTYAYAYEPFPNPLAFPLLPWNW
jgi:uncharacterized protein YraI